LPQYRPVSMGMPQLSHVCAVVMAVSSEMGVLAARRVHEGLQPGSRAPPPRRPSAARPSPGARVRPATRQRAGSWARPGGETSGTRPGTAPRTARPAPAHHSRNQAFACHMHRQSRSIMAGADHQGPGGMMVAEVMRHSKNRSRPVWRLCPSLPRFRGNGR